MNLPPNPPILQILPASAPFTPEKSTCLGTAAPPLSNKEAAALLPDLLAPSAGDAGDDERVPWHDPAIPIAERMKVAQGASLPLRMMAAMAQQDCGQCGSSCREYSGSIYLKTEERLNLCVPGGKETSRMLKKLFEEIGETAPRSAPAAAA